MGKIKPRIYTGTPDENYYIHLIEHNESLVLCIVDKAGNRVPGGTLAFIDSESGRLCLYGRVDFDAARRAGITLGSHGQISVVGERDD